jgi:dTDP-4-dehydrorhamnose reductase
MDTNMMTTGIKRLLVTGAGGFLGWNICRAALGRYDVIGVARRRPVVTEGVVPEQCDLTDFQSLRSLFQRVRPDAVIHAAAMPSPDVCQQHPAESRAINVDAAISIAGLCRDRDIPCAFTSSDLVFDGTAAPYDERRSPSPISVYGEQKLAAEQSMADCHDRMVICRMPLMYGDAPPLAQSFIQPFIRAIIESRALSLFFDEFRTPASGAAAARGILLALEREEKLLHLGGRESVSRYDFCRKLAAALGRPDASLTPVRQQSVKSVAPRPLNVSLDSSKAFALGYDPGPIERELGLLECVRKNRREGA